MADILLLVLSHLRVIDLADYRGIMCAKVLGDLGADVVKVEPPGGDSARAIGPFVGDKPGIESSLFWRGFATNRRSVTLDITNPRGRNLLKRLIGRADIVVESFAPGYLAGLGLSYSDLHAINAGLVMVSITPFGQTGPRATQPATDLTGVALGGSMALSGEPDRPPVRVGHSPQFWLLGGAAGAAGAMIAHYHKTQTSKGQHVDVSCQQAVARTLSHAPQVWDLAGENLGRNGAYRMIGDVRMRITYPCLDGYVSFFYPGGTAGARSMDGLAKWMREEGVPSAYVEKTDWRNFEFGTIPQVTLDRLDATLEHFFAGRSKADLAAGALAHRVILFPASDAFDLLSHPQLLARGFWQSPEPIEGHHDTASETLKHPGVFVRTDSEEGSPRRRAPTLGEHTEEVMEEEFGLSSDDIAQLRAEGAI